MKYKFLGAFALKEALKKEGKAISNSLSLVFFVYNTGKRIKNK